MKIPFFRRREVTLPEQAAQDCDLGRNRVFYMREQGLVTAWYLAQRCEEECYRAERYERPLVLLVVELAPESSGSTVQRQVADWLCRELRRADIAAYLGSGCYAILLPETDRDEARRLAARLHGAIQQVGTGFSCYPQDGRNFGDLTIAARGTLGQVAEQAA